MITANFAILPGARTALTWGAESLDTLSNSYNKETHWIVFFGTNLNENAKIEGMIAARIPQQTMMILPYQPPKDIGPSNFTLLNITSPTLLSYGINEVNHSTLLIPAPGVPIIVAEDYICQSGLFAEMLITKRQFSIMAPASIKILLKESSPSSLLSLFSNVEMRDLQYKHEGARVINHLHMSNNVEMIQMHDLVRAPSNTQGMIIM
jgi:hypothetical protein